MTDAGALGPVMMDLAGLMPDGEERELAMHPAVGGVVLFGRNYEAPAQLAALTGELRRLRSPPLLLAVDHEGGRVQRFRDGFTALPAAGRIGACHGRDPAAARALAEAAGLVAAAELRRAGLDLDFAPVLDLDGGNREIIGDRAFHADPDAVADLAAGWLRGMARAGFAGVGKHFPGHGTARGDTHVGVVTDERPLEALRSADLRPFAALAPSLGAVMTGHVRYPAVDGEAPTFSRRWLEGVLRRELGFTGIVLSDDLSMSAAGEGGSTPEARVEAAFAAGCDAALVLNDRPALVRVLDGWRPAGAGGAASRRARGLERLRPAERSEAGAAAYRAARVRLREFAEAGSAPGARC